MMKMKNFEAMEREYLKQQTQEGQAAISVKRELLKRFRAVTGTTPLNVGVVQPLYNAQTGKIINYFYAE